MLTGFLKYCPMRRPNSSWVAGKVFLDFITYIVVGNVFVHSIQSGQGVYFDILSGKRLGFCTEFYRNRDRCTVKLLCDFDLNVGHGMILLFCVGMENHQKTDQKERTFPVR